MSQTDEEPATTWLGTPISAEAMARLQILKAELTRLGLSAKYENILTHLIMRADAEELAHTLPRKPPVGSRRRAKK